MLAEGYTGQAALVNLLQDLLISVGEPEAVVRQILLEHLTEVTLGVFDPGKADAVFQSSGQPPAWLEELIRDPTWQILLFRLADAYPQCLLLRYAVRRVAEQGGIEALAAGPASATAVGTAAAVGSVFVFRRLLSRCLTNLSAPSAVPADPAEFAVRGSRVGPQRQRLTRSQSLLCSNEATFFFGQRMLDGGGAAASAPAAHRLQQEALVLARRRNAADAHALSAPLLRLTGGATDGDQAAVERTVVALVSDAAGALSPGDIVKLHSLLGGRAVPAAAVQNPFLLGAGTVCGERSAPRELIIVPPFAAEMLVDELFTPTRSLVPVLRTKATDVLAVAVTTPPQQPLDLASPVRPFASTLPTCLTAAQAARALSTQIRAAHMCLQRCSSVMQLHDALDELAALLPCVRRGLVVCAEGG
jgi:hypothetical protein